MSVNDLRTLFEYDPMTGVVRLKRRLGLRGQRADIRFEGKRFNLGRYETVEEAKEAYDTKAQELFGEYARS